ncbi:hypothetical protein D3C81_2120020 [compost metagenome]
MLQRLTVCAVAKAVQHVKYDVLEARRARLQQAVQQVARDAGTQLEDGLVQALLRAASGEVGLGNRR